MWRRTGTFLSILLAVNSQLRNNFRGQGTFARDFSNFVDLPSQRQQATRAPAALQATHPECAVALPGYESLCITYESVNNAFAIALETARLDTPLRFPPQGNFTNRDIGNLGTVIHETARELAREYGLSTAFVQEGLVQIDTSKTVISQYCPHYLRERKCEALRYRDIEGTCNNLDNPYWGAAMMAHNRFLPPVYADGISAPRVAVSGRPLPSPRLISSHLHLDGNIHDHAITTLLVAWAQFTDHDITLTAEIDEILEREFNCCKGPNVTHPMCLPIEIPANDHFYSLHGRTCMNFVRSNSGLRPQCRIGPRESFNLITSVIDAGTVYGNEPSKLEKLRAYQGGLMKTLPVFQDLGLMDLLPLSLEEPDKGCIRPNGDVFCFSTGDPRVNEQTVLCLLHTFFIREHNRLARDLAVLNPHWNDETLFQEARHIVAAVVQHITFNEFLPLVLGKSGIHEHGLTLYSKGYFDKYDPSINPSAAQGFTTAAYRFGHSLLPSTVERWSKTHHFAGTQKLHEMIQQPYDLFKPGWADMYVGGMINQVAQAMDDFITAQVTNHLFEMPGETFGFDLISLNIQRGREHAIPSYNRYREFCEMKPIKQWTDLYGIMPNHSIISYSKIYEDPEDLDLFTAGVSEFPMQGRLLGPTFSCIIGRMYHNLRHGDRFWYENGGWPSSFSLEQLEEIRKVTVARIICDNTNNIETIQIRPMLLTDPKLNPRVACNSGVIPRLDLSYWRDFSGQV